MNPYKILGLSGDATEDEIKAAFKKQARKWHPDLHQKDEDKEKAEAKFKEINEAYQILTNKNQRNSPFDGLNVEDMFNQHFNHGPPRNMVINVGYIAIDLEQVMSGTTKSIELVSKDPCGDCNGMGAKLGADSCGNCGGSGHVNVSSGGQTFAIFTNCKPCRGTGKKIESVCEKCKGQGTITKTEKVDVNIPKGTRHGTHIGVKEKCVATVVHNDHPTFKRINRRPLDLGQDISISWLDALLGASKEVTTLEDSKKIKIKPCIQSGSILRIKDSGLINEKGQKGHMFVNINIEMPKSLTKEQIEYLEKIKELDV